jgi:two-component system chemotaxis sensor kinase CheA
MSLSPESLTIVEDALSRLATEFMLSQPGRDDGLVPSYSLINTLADACVNAPELHEAVNVVRARYDALLDAAKPFDEPTLSALSRLLAWMPGALTAVKKGAIPEAFSPAEPASTQSSAAVKSADADEEPADALLELNLAENRELLQEFHAEAVDHLQQIEAALLALEQQPGDPEALNSIFRSFHTIKGNAGFLGLVPMQLLAHEVESLLDLARNHQLALTPSIVTEILRSRDALQVLTQQVSAALERGELPEQIVPVRHLIVAVKRLAQGQPAPEVTPAVPAASAAVQADHEPAEVPLPVAAHAAVTAATPAPVIPISGEVAAAPTAGPKSSVAQTVRVNTEKLDSLMDVVGELVIVQSQLLESASALGDGSPIQRNAAQLSRIAKELQHTAMALRMIPIKPTFQKMERLARDLSHSFGKKVQFQVAGEDTELDRTMVEEIGDPLVHMVRNALDHGLEAPEARLAAGKPEQGTVSLRAYHQGSHIIIELVDDGRGIDPEKILKKAIEKGIVAPGAQLAREQIFALIFAPGFSTAEKVTNVSGRGVGMDVVKRNIEKLRGKIEIESEVGKGSTFKLKLPLTTAIIDGLVVRVGTDRFILPSTSVQMALRPTRESITTVHGTGEVLERRGKILPVHRLHRRFGIPSDASQPWEGIVVIVEHSGRVSALLVDEMVSKQEVVIKNLGAFMQGLPGVSGGAILGDGSIALILDPASLLAAA